MEREWDEVENMERSYRYDPYEPSTYELAEAELKAQEQHYILQDMMGEQYHNYFWDEKHSL